jgi:hypothetical protein
MSKDPSLPPEPLPLTEASCQEIELELMRRRCFNQFDGPKIVASLRRHRSLWLAALKDRPGLASDGETLGGLELIKLRDLPANYWNVDTLFISTPDVMSGQKLLKIAEAERWDADVARLHENEEERSRALGTSDPPYVVSFWWD